MIVVNIAVLCIIGVKLSRIPADEMLLNTARWLVRLVCILSHSPLTCSQFSVLLGNMLPALAFSLKFLQWWYSGDQKWVGLGALPAPPPPSAPPVSHSYTIRLIQILFCSHTPKECEWLPAPPTVHCVSIPTARPLLYRPVDTSSAILAYMTMWENMAAVQ